MLPIREFWRCDSEERRLLLLAALTLAVVRGALSLFSMHTLLSLDSHFLPDDTTTDVSRRTVRRIGWAVETTSSYVPGRQTCLTRALAGYLLLRNAGQPARIRIGVTRTDSGVDAHAWVDSDGHVAIGAIDGLSEFEPFPIENGS